jgi:hypothetical protein
VQPGDHLEADRLGQAGGFVKSGLDVAGIVAPAEIGERDDGTGAASELVVGITIENAQAADSSSSWSMKLTGRSG